MFIYLSKKIAIPNGVRLKSVSWNPDHGWIACGGENGLLKVLKLESEQSKENKARGVAAPTTLSMNQTLEGHSGAVCVVTWNANYRKLTTSDQFGLIIVWMLHKGVWYEEMINNRNKSVVRDMKWTSDGQKICIVYEDGAVIVGSYDGNRLWGKELKESLQLVEWSPEGRVILFVTTDGKVLMYDSLGTRLGQLPLYAVEDTPEEEISIVGLHWYDGSEGYVDSDAPSLAVAFSNGRVQITRRERDDRPVLIDTGMELTQCRWNTNGTVLALAGVQRSGERRAVSMVQFYSTYGHHLRTLKVPGGGISALGWEGGGLRIALAVDCFIYFANIRPDYLWGYFCNTLAYAYNKPDKTEHTVVFWELSSSERYVKTVRKLLSITAAGENCVMATRVEDKEGQYLLILCNAIGSPVDTKYIDRYPKHVCMTKYHIIVADDFTVYAWQYRTPVSKLTSIDTGAGLRRKEGRERMFHIDDGVDSRGGGRGRGGGGGGGGKTGEMPEDPICCLAASERVLVVGRESGTVQRYTLPHISLETVYYLPCRPQYLALNCDCTRMSIIDINSFLSFLNMRAGEGAGSVTGRSRGGAGGELPYERKDVWSMMWAEDNPELFALMEKTRMYIYRDMEPEEPVLSSGYLCAYRDLQIKAVLLDEVMASPGSPEADIIIDYEAKSLRDARELLSNVGIHDAFKYIADRPHPRLWRLLAEAALEQLDFTVAEKAFVSCSDYQGIRFVKRLTVLDDKTKQRAEVAAYFRQFEKAELLYREMDRKDLAIDLRMRLGDWFRVVQLLQGPAGDDTQRRMAWNRIGDYYADRLKWHKAVQYYVQGKSNEALVRCYYHLGNFSGLVKVAAALPEGAELLLDIGEKLTSVGMGEQAAEAFLKGGDVKAAIDACVMLNQWNHAVKLAEEHSFPQIETLFERYASHLLEKGAILEAIELYRKAQRHVDAARLLSQMAQKVSASKVNPLRAKKLQVLAALEVLQYRSSMLDPMAAGGAAGGATTQQTLHTLVTVDAATGDDRALDAPWRGAEAYHFFILAQRQLYEGLIDESMNTALRLQEYDDILDAKDIYSLIALTAHYNSHFGQCSDAFVKLESLDSLDDKEREAYAQLALTIFMSNPPVDPAKRAVDCPRPGCIGRVQSWYTKCLECNYKLHACLVTGRAILDSRYRACPVCRHRCQESAARGLVFCPLCHAALDS
eukprot:PLAT5272.2.p1 GENE.PLAT5272.2~~PLAT5272.2.p1  ORF type:complete len:1194 (+),score=710.47 PLAT5272.2:43-3624(+)